MKMTSKRSDQLADENEVNLVPSFSYRITYRDFPPSESVSRAVEERLAKLDRFELKITNCEVVLSFPHHHNHKSQIFYVHIRLHIPGKDIYIDREPGHNTAHGDIYLAIRDAFHALERRLEEKVRRQRGFVKRHELRLTKE